MLFNGKYLSDEQIWSRIEGIINERNTVQNELAHPDVISNPQRMAELAKRLYQLEQLCVPLENLKSELTELKNIEEFIAEEGIEDEEDDYMVLYRQHLEQCNISTSEVYQFLLDNGYLDEEYEDDTDLEILKFLDYAGAEYAWRLGINIGIDVVESRSRLEKLLHKGLIEKVQGTMLGNYHRQKDWIKHMNHTYYRISRVGKLYLRELRREQQGEEV